VWCVPTSVRSNDHCRDQIDKPQAVIDAVDEVLRELQVGAKS
jgi:hypothetical protein